jgi:hypothetical protein
MVGDTKEVNLLSLNFSYQISHLVMEMGGNIFYFYYRPVIRLRHKQNSAWKMGNGSLEL